MDKSHAVKRLLRFFLIYLVGQSSMKFLTLYFMLNSGLLFPYPCGRHIWEKCRLYKFAFWHQHTFIERCFRRNLSFRSSPNWDFLFVCRVHFNCVNAIVDKIIELLSTYGEHKQCGTNDYIKFTADDDIITNKFFALSQFHLFCTARCYFCRIIAVVVYIVLCFLQCFLKFIWWCPNRIELFTRDAVHGVNK